MGPNEPNDTQSGQPTNNAAQAPTNPAQTQEQVPGWFMDPAMLGELSVLSALAAGRNPADALPDPNWYQERAAARAQAEAEAAEEATTTATPRASQGPSDDELERMLEETRQELRHNNQLAQNIRATANALFSPRHYHLPSGYLPPAAPTRPNLTIPRTPQVPTEDEATQANRTVGAGRPTHQQQATNQLQQVGLERPANPELAAKNWETPLAEVAEAKTPAEASHNVAANVPVNAPAQENADAVATPKADSPLAKPAENQEATSRPAEKPVPESPIAKAADKAVQALIANPDELAGEIKPPAEVTEFDQFFEAEDLFSFEPTPAAKAEETFEDFAWDSDEPVTEEELAALAADQTWQEENSEVADEVARPDAPVTPAANATNLQQSPISSRLKAELSEISQASALQAEAEATEAAKAGAKSVGQTGAAPQANGANAASNPAGGSAQPVAPSANENYPNETQRQDKQQANGTPASGDVILVLTQIGDIPEAIDVAGRLAQRLTRGGQAAQCVLAGAKSLLPGDEVRVRSANELNKVRTANPEQIQVLVVADSPVESHARTASRLLENLRPAQTWGVWDARRELAEAQDWMGQAPYGQQVQELALHHVWEATDPLSYQTLPVGWLDGAPAHPMQWEIIKANLN
ncbi:hypothetical protein BK816_01350 [Boudabousia tangfeifanii]|uniref:Uncharacterized protein n=1 Tax=Boudabousia tangfeifanii TaxID=1912795 RepID=A0A1D9MIT2_9ACTO|nr:hypothetical protein [Boudabousia tangfeifanii]AOZ72108.1 hypothetical protein BK816_01350 [Boudabousia tangfeifanii]